MGSPRTPFGSFAFTTLLTSPSIEVVATHFSQLAETLREFYPIVRISWEEALQRFSWVLSGNSHDRLKADYSFQAGTDDAFDQWRVIFYRTQIPHLESGLSFGEQNTTVIDPKLACRLVQKKLATVVVYKKSLETERSFLSQLSVPNVQTSIVGEITGLYLILKFDSIRSLQRKWKWEFFQEGSFPFSEFFSELSAKLSATNIEPIVTIAFEKMDPLRQFVANCDSELRTALTRSKLEKTLALINVSFNEWFGAKI